jgi:hypothetical protein
LHGVQHLLLVQSFELISFHLKPRLRDTSHNRGRTTDGIGLGFGFGLLLLGDCLNLVEVALKDGGVGDVFCGFGELEEDHPGTYSEEAEDDGDDLLWRAFEALEEDGGGDDGGAGEVDVVGGCDEGGVEDV